MWETPHVKPNQTQKILSEKAKESNSDLAKQDQHLWQQKDPEGAVLSGLEAPAQHYKSL